MSAADRFVDALEQHDCRPRGHNGKWEARCPAHDDRSPSLSVKQVDDRVLVNCHAGCEIADIVAAVGLELGDLFDERKNGSSSIVAEYDYVDEGGKVLYQVVRFWPKGFRQRRPDGNGWEWKLGDTRRVLYRLPRVLEAIAKGEDVMVVEGEKDVHALEKLGIVATCNPGGAGKWRSDYSEALRGAKVTVVADRDDAGREHARRVAAELERVAESVELVEPSKGKDVADLIAVGGGLADLVEPTSLENPEISTLVAPYISTATNVPKFAVRQLREDRMRATRWAYKGFFPIGSLSALVGVGGTGKGTFMSHLIARWTRGELPGQHEGSPVRVLVIGDEDSPNEVWTPRILAAGGDVALVLGLEYSSGVPLDIVRDIGVLEGFVAEHEVQVVYLDQVLDHLNNDRVNSHTAHDVRSGLAPLRGLAGRQEIAVAYTMHPNKMAGGRSLRDRAGASGQFTDVPRSGMLLGYHPERVGVRVLARGKGNMGAVPDALTFTIESSRVVNPVTGEAIDVGRVCGLGTDPDLVAEEVSHFPAKDHEETKQEVAGRIIQELGSDGEWHSRLEAEGLCVAAGMSATTFKEVFRVAPLEKKTENRETWWRFNDGA